MLSSEIQLNMLDTISKKTEGKNCVKISNLDDPVVRLNFDYLDKKHKCFEFDTNGGLKRYFPLVTPSTKIRGLTHKGHEYRTQLAEAIEKKGFERKHYKLMLEQVELTKTTNNMNRFSETWTVVIAIATVLGVVVALLQLLRP